MCIGGTSMAMAGTIPWGPAIVPGARSPAPIFSTQGMMPAPTGTTRFWTTFGMSASGCSVTDINSDGRLDVVLIGSATANISWYENLGPDEQ